MSRLFSVALIATAGIESSARVRVPDHVTDADLPAYLARRAVAVAPDLGWEITVGGFLTRDVEVAGYEEIEPGPPKTVAEAARAYRELEKSNAGFVTKSPELILAGEHLDRMLGKEG